MKPTDLRFPALEIRKAFLGGHLSAKWLTQWYLSGIEQGHFKGMTLIDSEGACYIVSSVTIDPVPVWQRFLNPLVGQVVPVPLVLEPTQSPTLEDLRGRMLAFAKGEAWEGRDDRKETLAAISVGKAVSDLVKAFVEADFRTELARERTKSR